MKKNTLFSGFFIAAFLPLCTFAASQYIPLAPIPGFTDNDAATSGGLTGYLRQLYVFGVSAASLLALLMIIWGGIEYMTTDAIGHKEEGKEKIQSAILGLILAFGSYVILRTINKDLVNIRFDLQGIAKDGIVAKSLSEKDFAIVRPSVSNTYAFASDEGSEDADGRFVISPKKVAIDTDGREKPPFHDPHYQSQTSYSVNGQYLNANTDAYVVVPVGSDIPLGSKVLITNNTNGRSVMAIVGDRGPGYGEMSLAAARTLGVWTEGMGNAAKTGQSITYTFYK